MNKQTGSLCAALTVMLLVLSLYGCGNGSDPVSDVLTPTGTDSGPDNPSEPTSDPLASGDQTVSLTPGNATSLCPTHVRGDRDFGGHGPFVIALAGLELRGGGRELWMKIFLKAEETRSDWTTAERTWFYKLYTAPSGKRIKRILTGHSSTVTYTDTDHAADVFYRSSGLVSKFVIMGDTGGGDVGNCTADDVYMHVSFREVRVQVGN